MRHGRMASVYTGAVTAMTDMTWTYRLDCTHAVWEHDTAGHSGMYTDKMLRDKHHKATPVWDLHRDHNVRYECEESSAHRCCL